MKQVEKAAYKDAIHALRKNMARRMMGVHQDEDEGPAEMAEESSDPMAEEDEMESPEGSKSKEAEHELGLSGEDGELSDEEKHQGLFGRHKKGKSPGSMIVIAMGKKAKDGKGKR